MEFKTRCPNDGDMDLSVFEVASGDDLGEGIVDEGDFDVSLMLDDIERRTCQTIM
jgi:hypothetical protein